MTVLPSVSSAEPAAPRMYAELVAAVLFSDYRIEVSKCFIFVLCQTVLLDLNAIPVVAQSQSSNSILFEVDLHHLAKALTKSRQSSQVCSCDVMSPHVPRMLILSISAL